MFGRIQEYCPENELFSAYLERVQLFFLANGVEDEKKVPVFLSVVGSKTYSLLRNLVAPALPQNKTLDQLVAILKSHFEPKPVIIAERFHFHRRSQAMGESIAEYLAELRRLSTHCAFGDYLEQALRDRLVCGIRSESIQKKLLAEAELTLKRAVEIAVGMEAAEKTTKSLKEEVSPIQQISVPQTPRVPCSRCGKTSHNARDCRFQNAQCYKCGKLGHIASACRSQGQRKITKPQDQPRFLTQKNKGGQTFRTRYVETEREEEDSCLDDPEELPLYRVGSSMMPPIKIPLLVDNVLLEMELDTGAAITIISEAKYKEHFSETKLKESSTLLKTYSGERLKVIGEIEVNVEYENQNAKLILTVVAGEGPSLLGRNWLKLIRLNWHSIKLVNASKDSSLDYLLDKFSDVFAEKLGTIKSFSAKLSLKEGEEPKFFKPRSMPYAARGAIEEELDRLEQQGILEKVTYSEWATPIVAVAKPDGRYRICGDFKVTVNPTLKVDQYPLPKVDDLFATLAGGRKFTKLDLSQAYLQLELHPESRQYCTINTHRGLYQFTRLPFGISSAPAMFQKVMDTILQGAPQTLCFIDDILITGSSEEEHLKNLGEVLRRLQAHGVQLKKEKCAFMKESVEYLGHRVDASGIKATPEKIAAVENAPLPQNVQQLRSFLGLLNYYRKFLPNLATIVKPLNDLLQKGKKWSWSSTCTQAVRTAKQLLTASNVLTHYDPTLPLKLAADASQYGLGAVISHVLPGGEERPIAFASRSLSKSEQNYAQIDKEALALIFGVQKFHAYIFGRKFTLVTDHKPLTTILGPKKGIPSVAAARLQRWAILLSAYIYDIQFRNTAAHGNADALSRLPLPTKSPEYLSEVHLCNVEQIESLPVTSQSIRRCTRQDSVLSKVLDYTLKGWPSQVPKELQPYHTKLAELSVEEGCLLWGRRVIIPKRLHKIILQELHSEHMGIAKMKALARSHVWWTGLDKDLESLAKSCPECAAVKQAPARAPLHPWIWPSRPWQRIHLDFAGPFLGKFFFIVVDAHSKWAEVVEMSQTSTSRTITVLRQLFATHGIPEQIVTDNGSQFTSEDFTKFVKSNGIRHSLSSPYHPASNGEAERFVRTFKEAMKTSNNNGLTLAHRINNFLLTYRTTPHTTTGTPPSELLMGRTLRTRWDIMKPDVGQRVCWCQAKQKEGKDNNSKLRHFMMGQSVMVKNFRTGPTWMPGIIVQQLGPLTYMIEVSAGKFWKRHVDHVKDYPLKGLSSMSESPETDNEEEFFVPPVQVSSEENNTSSEENNYQCSSCGFRATQGHRPSHPRPSGTSVSSIP